VTSGSARSAAIHHSVTGAFSTSLFAPGRATELAFACTLLLADTELLSGTLPASLSALGCAAELAFACTLLTARTGTTLSLGHCRASQHRGRQDRCYCESLFHCTNLLSIIGVVSIAPPHASL
jgi:hypothetical protein